MVELVRTGKVVRVRFPELTPAEKAATLRRIEAGGSVLDLVLDKAGRVLGIFTDGDLRRHLPQYPDIVNMPVATLMTRNPIMVKADGLAVDVLQLFEKHNIDDLLVVDGHNKLVGAVDIQDLPKLKIM